MKLSKSNIANKFKRNLRIGLFGGSFDPVHVGHLELACAAKSEYQLDKIFFIPAKHPPHKLGKVLLPPAQRLKLLSLALKPYKNFIISRYELNRKDVTFSYQTADYFRSRFPSAEIYFIIGGDSLAELKTWKNAARLAATVKLLAGKRAGVKVPKRIPFKNSVFFLKKALPKVSSTTIRELAAAHKPISGLVSKSVEAAILKTRIYN
jgi:nicotinate-nucleotide adenylyltransferase